MAHIESILVIDDDADVGELVVAGAQGMGISGVATTNHADFLVALTPTTSLIFLDLMMPSVDGVETLRLLSEQGCTSGIVLMSGVGERIIETAHELAVSLGLNVVGHLQKPFRLPDLETLLTQTPAPTLPGKTFGGIVDLSEAELRAAVSRDEFVLHYQPQMDVVTGMVCGIEALVRWNRPGYGVVFPDSFIALLEESRLIDQVGWLVVRRAFTEMAALAEAHGQRMLLSLNVSVRSLQDLKFPDILAAFAQEHGIDLACVVLEITESGLVNEYCNTLDVLARLRLRGVQLSIDDFGTGYSMMQQLRLIPATELKVDKGFVQGMEERASNLVVVRKTIEIGHELGMRVVAEGVETEAQLARLREQGCDIAQGYLFSRPLPLAEMVEWLRKFGNK